jgi:hypothetical protein
LALASPWDDQDVQKDFSRFGGRASLRLWLTFNVGADDTALERPGYALTTLDGSGNVGQYSSVTIDTDGLGLISYYDATNGDLKVAHCSDLFCVSYHRRR